MASTKTKGPAAIAREYFEALGRQDLDAAAACWVPGGIDHLSGMDDLVAPQGVRDFFNEMFAAIPDFRFEILTVASHGGNAAVRWRATGTFNGSGRFQGLAPNGATIEIEGCDMLTINDGLIEANYAYLNGAELARQLGAMPPVGSAAEKAMLGALNAKTTALAKLRELRAR